MTGAWGPFRAFNGLLVEKDTPAMPTHPIQAIYTFEGTESIQTLIVGRDITGVSAFV